MMVESLTECTQTINTLAWEMLLTITNTCQVFKEVVVQHLFLIFWGKGQITYTVAPKHIFTLHKIAIVKNV